MSSPWGKIVQSYEWHLGRYVETGKDEVVAEACRDLFRAFQHSTPGAARVAELHLETVQKALGDLPAEATLSWAVVERTGKFLTRVLSALDALRDGTAELSHRDRLTGLPNRLAMMSELAGEAARSQRHARPLSLATICLSGFEQFPESSGDAAICRVAQSIRRVTRREDRVYRVSSTDFAIIFPDTPDGGARIAAQRLATGLNETFAYGEEDQLPGLRAGIGVATMPNDAVDPQSLMSLSGSRAQGMSMHARVVSPLLQG